MSESEIEQWKRQLDGMTAEDLVALRRFAYVGHPVFRSDLPLYEYFQQRLKQAGGMTPQVSKSVGWGK